jgi:hypothetical protein
VRRREGRHRSRRRRPQTGLEGVGFYRGGGWVRAASVEAQAPGPAEGAWELLLEVGLGQVGGAAPVAVARRMAGREGKAARRRVQAGPEDGGGVSSVGCGPEGSRDGAPVGSPYCADLQDFSHGLGRWAAMASDASWGPFYIRPVNDGRIDFVALVRVTVCTCDMILKKFLNSKKCLAG